MPRHLIEVDFPIREVSEASGCSFALEVCRQGSPPLGRVGEEHYVACCRFVGRGLP